MGKLYEFKEEDAYSFARHVHIEAKQRGRELQFYHCPYCRGGKGGKDKWNFFHQFAHRAVQMLTFQLQHFR